MNAIDNKNKKNKIYYFSLYEESFWHFEIALHAYAIEENDPNSLILIQSSYKEEPKIIINSLP